MTEEKTILFNELADLLTQENDIHQRLIDAAQEINDSARGNNVDALKVRATIFDDHICSLEKAEERRIDVCGRLQNLLCSTAPSGRMISLIEHSEPTLRSRLKSLRASLMERVAKLKALNTSNIVLFREALGGISATIDMVKSAATPKTGYQHRGTFKPAVAGGLSMFNQVV